MSDVERLTRRGVEASERKGFWVHGGDFNQKIEQGRNREAELQRRLTAADRQIDELTQERERLIAYGRSCGLDEASTLCSRMAYDAYYPAGSRFKVFTPKAQKALSDVLIKAANKIASLSDGPYERFKARQAKQEESAKSR